MYIEFLMFDSKKFFLVKYTLEIEEKLQKC